MRRRKLLPIILPGLLLFIAAVVSVAGVASIAQAQSTPGQLPGTAMPTITSVPPGAQASPNFNADTATDAYLALIPAEAKARSDAYFEGGYWLTLWEFIWLAGSMLLLLNLGWSAGCATWPSASRASNRCRL